MAKVVEWSQGLENLSNGEGNKEITEGKPSQPERDKTVRWFGDLLFETLKLVFPVLKMSTSCCTLLISIIH